MPQNIEVHAHHIELHQPVEQGTRTDGYHAQYQHAVEEPVAHLEPSDEMAFLVREVVFEEGVASQIALVEVVDMSYEHLQQSYQGDKQQGIWYAFSASVMAIRAKNAVIVNFTAIALPRFREI